MMFFLSAINIIIIFVIIILIYRTPQIEYRNILFALMVLQLVLITTNIIFN